MKLFPERHREHEFVHARTTEQQMLDALLRIEEVLLNLNETLAGPRVVNKVEEPELSMSQFVSKDDLKAAKATKKNPRSL